MKLFLILMLMIFAVGCSSMSKSECQTLDLKARGQADALNGHYPPNENFAKYENVCRQHKVILSQQPYFEGYENGLAQFCAPETAIKWALEHSEPVYCPQPLKSAYHAAFKPVRIQVLKKLVQEYEDDVSSRRFRVSSAESKLSFEKNQEQGKPGTIERANYDSAVSSAQSAANNAHNDYQAARQLWFDAQDELQKLETEK